MDAKEQVVNKKLNKGCLWVLIVNVVLFSILAILLVYTSGNKKSDPKRNSYYMAKQFIEKQLKVPSTAEYQEYSEDMVEVSGNVYKVTMYVDAENSFGAKVRTHFIVQMKTDGDKWYIADIKEIQ